MILKLLQNAQSQLQKWTEFQQDRQRSDQLDLTLHSLSSVEKAAMEFSRRYGRVVDRLHTELPLGFEDRIASAQRMLTDSQSKFATAPHQVKALGDVEKEITRLNQELTTAWAKYVQRALKPKQDLYDLLKELPEIQRNSMQIRNAFVHLQQSEQQPPKDAASLKQFDLQLEQITQTLTHVEGLTPTIRDFLQRMHRNEFTVADLNEDILAWCRVNDRGRSFKIRA